MFEISNIPESDSGDSDVEIPKFHVAAFDKYPSHNKKPSSLNDDYHNKSITLSSSIDAGEQYDKICMPTSFTGIKEQMTKEKELLRKRLDENLKKSVISKEGFFEQRTVAPILSVRQIKKLAKKERAKTKGPQWGNMPAPEMTEEKKNDLLVLQMRQALNPKRFYKRSAQNTNPKFFQVGTFVESPVDFYSSRLPKKARKQTLVDELMADAEFRQYQKRKYQEIEYSKPKAKFHRKKIPNRMRHEARSGKSSKSDKKSSKSKRKK